MPLARFQDETVKAALKVFSSEGGPRRFLVADEVGLGKTIVARTVIEKLQALSPERRLNVFYVTSGQAIAEQNRQRLAGEGGAEQPDDRLSLLATAPHSAGRGVRVYALTPLTSFPAVARGGRGRVAERALLTILLQRLRFRQELIDPGVKQQTWNNNLTYWKRNFRRLLSPNKLPAAFYRSLTALLNTDDPLDLLSAKSTQKGGRSYCLHAMRCALALTALRRKDVRPDLIILDEFQKFPWVLHPESEKVDPMTARLIGNVYSGDDKARPALLLLSATPYRLRSDNEGDSHREFYRVISFLAGGGVPGERAAKKLNDDFSVLRNGLFKLGASENSTGIESREPLDDVRDRIETTLRKFVARTERADDPTYAKVDSAPPLLATLTSGDIAVFDDFARRFRQAAETGNSSARRASGTVVPLWHSVPYPMQTLGPSYSAWNVARNITNRPLSTGCSLPTAGVKPGENHPKLRRLLELFRQDSTNRLPWLAPTLPWWELGGDWANAGRSGKLLIFSGFKASPGAISAILSQDIETELRGRSVSYDRLWESSRFRDPGVKPNPALYSLFFPWPMLLEIQPPKRFGLTRAEAREAIKAKLIGLLEGWSFDGAGKPRPLWKLVSLVCKVTPLAEKVILAANVGRSNNSMEMSVARWRKAAAAPKILSQRELNLLSEFVLAAPGVVLARAFARHWPEARDHQSLSKLFEVAWGGLRPYLGCRLFDGALAPRDSRKRRRRNVQDDQRALLAAIIEGNLESALDENFAMARRSSPPNLTKVLRELRQSLRLHVGRTRLQAKPGTRQSSAKPSGVNALPRSTNNYRTHIAIPFQVTEVEGTLPGEEGKPLHQDVLRRAFNSPFWPHTLVTTSVGQEGLDFHVWCDQLLHWDLPNNPIDLEQREGRINRFAGLTIRRALTRDPGKLLAKCPSDGSPWAVIFDENHSFTETSEKASGLAPWWVLEGALPNTMVIELPLSRQVLRLKRLRDDLLFYRLALGQPDIRNFVAKARTTLKSDDVARYVLDLSPLRLRSDRRKQ